MVADFANIAPFFQDSKFPRDWFRRATPYTAMNTVTDVIKMCTSPRNLPARESTPDSHSPPVEQAPVALGANEGLGNFVSIEGLSVPTDSPQALSACIPVLACRNS